MNRKQILTTGVVAIGASALAFCVYKGYKYVKAEKERREQEDLEIAVEMVNREVAKSVEEQLKLTEMRSESLDEWLKEASEVDEAQEQLELMLESQQDPPEEENTMTNADVMEAVKVFSEATNDIYVEEDEEVETVRHDPNSVTALEQFKDMRMADIKNPDTKALVRQLFEVPFNPQNEDDETIGMHIDDARIEFFGDGRWVGERTFADLILHFAFLLNFDLERSVNENVEFLIKNLDIRPLDTQWNLIDMMKKVERHMYETRYGFGMFALPDSYSTFMQEYWNYAAPEMEISDMIEEEENA